MSGTACDFCEREVEGIPFSCGRCGGTFCAEHRLPESHHCTGRRHRTVQAGFFRRLLCRVGMHDWAEPRSESVFRSNVIDWHKECRCCGVRRSWVEPKKR